MSEIKIRFQDITNLCNKIERDLEDGFDVDLVELNDMILNYFPHSELFNHYEAEEVAERMKNIERLLAIKRDVELEQSLEEIEQLKKYGKYIRVLEMVEEPKWK